MGTSYPAFVCTLFRFRYIIYEVGTRLTLLKFLTDEAFEGAGWWLMC